MFKGFQLGNLLTWHTTKELAVVVNRKIGNTPTDIHPQVFS